MKYVILVLSMAVAQVSWANKNISVTVDGVTYSCTGNPPGNECAGKVAGLRATMESCNKSYNGGYCVQTYWPRFKKSNANCALDGLPICLEYCGKSYNGGYCAEFCSE